MLTLSALQAETLWDELLPVEARRLPEDLARIDELLGDRRLLRPIAAHWQREAEARGRSAAGHGRPTIAMETYVRLMVVKQRSGWGYETLVREVSDSLHLRRFCLIPLHAQVPDESTIRKLTRRLGPAVAAELTRALIEKAARGAAFPPARGEGRLHRGGGRHQVSDRRGAGAAGGAGAGARGPQARRQAARRHRTGARPLALDLADGAPDRAHARAPHRGGEGRGDAPQRAGGPADPPLGRRGQAARRPDTAGGARARGAHEAAGRARARGARRPVRASGRADREARPWREDRGPAGLDRRPGRPPNQKGQARQADRVRLRRAALRADRQHPAGGARPDPAARDRAG
jgi:transposase, IS5 family